MNETVLVAVVAVVGTLAGAFASPLIAAVAKGRTRRVRRDQSRIEAATTFSASLLDLAVYGGSDYDSPVRRKYKMKASTARLDFCRHVEPGEGQADTFSEFAVSAVLAHLDEPDRMAIAHHVARRVFEWARRERKASTLMPFTTTRGRHGAPVIFERDNWADAYDDGELLRGRIVTEGLAPTGPQKD